MKAKSGGRHFILAVVLEQPGTFRLSATARHPPGARNGHWRRRGRGHWAGDRRQHAGHRGRGGGGRRARQCHGRRMDEGDRQNIAQALSENETRTWTNSETNANYRVDPVDTVRRDGKLCREYEMTATIEGEPRQVEGLACQESDGTWRVVS